MSDPQPIAVASATATAAAAAPATAPVPVAAPAVVASPPDLAPPRYYAFHTRKKPGRAKHAPPAQPLVQPQPQRSHSSLLASFDDEWSDSSDSSDSGSSDSDSSSSDEETPAKAARRRATENSRPAAARPPTAASLSSARASVATVAGVPAVPASNGASLSPLESASGMARAATAAARAGASLSASPTGSYRGSRIKVSRDMLTPLLGAEIAPTVERELYQKHSGVSKAYNAHVRQLVSSLRMLQAAPDASTLLADVQAGRITPAQLVAMNSKELANDNLRRQREQQERDDLRDMQKPKEITTNVFTLRDQQLEEQASRQLEKAIQLQRPDAPAPVRYVPTFDLTSPTSALASAQRAENAASAAGAAASSSAPLKRKPPTAPVTSPNKPAQVLSSSSSGSDMSDGDDELLIIDVPKPRAVPRALKSALSVSAAAPRGTGAATLIPSLKRKSSSTDEFKASGTGSAPLSSLRTPSAAVQSPPPAKRSRLSKSLSIVTARSATETARSNSPTGSTPTPPPLEDVEHKATDDHWMGAAAADKLHPTDPLQLPVRADDASAIPAYTGKLSVALPRRGELFVAFDPLPTRDLFPAGSGVEPHHAAVLSASDLNCWSHILPDDRINDLKKMRVSELDRYIRFKADAHKAPSARGVVPSASIQATSRVYPVTFTLRSTEPLLQDFMNDVTTFCVTNSFALAVDLEKSSLPPARQCVLWLVPPGSLQYVPHATARDILQWESRPRADQWWGVMWVKLFAWRAMRRSVAAAIRRAQNEMDVPSDEDEEPQQQPQPQPQLLPTQPQQPSEAAVSSSAVVETSGTFTSVLQLIQDKDKIASTANYLNSLLNKISAASPAAAAVVLSAPIPVSAPSPVEIPHTSSAALAAPVPAPVAGLTAAPSLSSLIASIHSSAVHSHQSLGSGGVPIAVAPPMPAHVPAPAVASAPIVHAPFVAAESSAPLTFVPSFPTTAVASGWQPQSASQPFQPALPPPPPTAPLAPWQPSAHVPYITTHHHVVAPPPAPHAGPAAAAGGWQTTELEPPPFAAPAPVTASHASPWNPHLQSTVHPSRTHTFTHPPPQQQQPRPRW